MPLATGTRIGPYDVTGALGAGGMGEVYRGRDTNLNRDVALKILPESFAGDADRVARFKREAQLLASLNHPNIAQIYGFEATTDARVSALVMELVEGDDLSEVIARGPIAWSDALPIARQIVDALEAAHELGIVHRDLKPANIKVRDDGAVKVLDFGLAKALTPDAGIDASNVANSPTLTARGTEIGVILGTAAYMAPEQARGKAVDRRADIWAFGVVLYEMLSGRRAFAGDDVSITLANVLKEEVKWPALPADLPPSVHRLLRRCLEKDPKRRLSAIGDARLELDDVSTAAPGAPARRGRQIVPWAIAAAAGIAAVYFASMALGGASGSAATTWTSIPAPVDQFSRYMGPAVSPDGQSIAFSALDDKGQDQIWVRRLDAQSAQMLPGTQGGGSPFWSPDSQYVAFFKDQKLHTVGAAGGAPRMIADVATNSRGGTWNKDGVIVFVPAPALGLRRVSASAGGATTPLEGFKDEPGTLSMYPSFLPDGDHFLYTHVGDEGAWISVGSLTSGRVKRLVAAYSRAEYAAGYLLFGSKSSLFAQPFDPSTLTLSGERVRIVESVGGTAGHTVNYAFSVSADGSRLVTGNRPYLALSQLTWFDRNGARQGVLGEPVRLFGFSVAPDRKRVALEKFDAGANSMDPWITQIDTGFTSPLRSVSEGALSSSPTWSHDGQRMFFSSGYGTMRLVPVAGGAAESWPLGPHWPLSSAPDGSVVLITQTSTATSADLMIVPLTGDHTPKPYLQTPFNEGTGRFSPSGAWVAYVSNASSRNEVYIQSYPTLGQPAQVSATGGTHPEWNLDGSELYFAHEEPDGTRSLMVARVSGRSVSTPTRLFNVGTGSWEGIRSGFAVFDNGRRFLVSVLLPVTSPQVITVGQNWIAGIGKR